MDQNLTKYVKEWQSIFKKDVVDIFEPHVQKVMVFNKPKNWNESSKGNSVHIDEGGITCALNIVLPTQDNKATMQWFDTDVPKEELLIGDGTLKKMFVLRRILNPMGTVDAMEFLLDKISQTKDNNEFYDSMNT